MQRIVSGLLILVGLIIAGGAFVIFSGQSRIIGATLGLIIACGGCLMQLVSAPNAKQYRPFIIIISILFIFLIIGFIIKTIVN